MSVTFMLALARENSFTIVEDDCLGDLAFDGLPRQTLRGQDGGDTVLYLNLFSKSLVPGCALVICSFRSGLKNG